MSGKDSYIMIVDDSDIIREAITKIIEESGFQAGSAEDGIEALQLIETCMPKLVFSDVEMPRCDGINLALKLQEKYGDQSPPIVLLTGHIAWNDSNKSPKNVKASLSKVASLKDIEQQIKKLLNEI